MHYQGLAFAVGESTSLREMQANMNSVSIIKISLHRTMYGYEAFSKGRCKNSASYVASFWDQF